ncbi:MAG: alpha amylase C-terminal domain-containing protein, partial [Acidimicrobiia bacterium]|nr:alpha amylase C-terminal domain-containing protein [Acidimicrobiia bacterium]
RVGVPLNGEWAEILNSDDSRYWGSGQHLNQPMRAEDVPWHGQDKSVLLNLPPLGAVFLKPSS